MNGADALITTLADNGVTACFANPGTSEMQFVAALKKVYAEKAAARASGSAAHDEAELMEESQHP